MPVVPPTQEVEREDGDMVTLKNETTAKGHGQLLGQGTGNQDPLGPLLVLQETDHVHVEMSQEAGRPAAGDTAHPLAQCEVKHFPTGGNIISTQVHTPPRTKTWPPALRNPISSCLFT